MCMKIEWNKKYTTIAAYTVIVIVIGVLSYHVLNNFSYFRNIIEVICNLLIPFLYGFSFAYIFNPVLNWFEKRVFPWISRNKMPRKTCRYLGVVCTLILGIALISFLLGMIVPQLAISIANVVSQITVYASDVQDLIVKFISRFKNSDVFLPVIQNLMTYIEELIKSFMSMLSQSFSGIINATISTTITITSTIINIFVGCIIAVYLWISKETFFAQLKKLLYAFLPESFVEHILNLTTTANFVFGGFIIGKIIDSLIIGIICYIGMSILNIPYALLISVIVCVTNVIPYFGPFIGAIPSILLLLFINPMKSLWFTIFIIVLQQIDGNIIGPKILGESTGLSAFWVIFAVTLFGGLFGFVGMIIGVPLFAVIYAIIKGASENRLVKKEMPTETKAYASDSNPLMPMSEKKMHRKPKNRR